MVYPIEIFLKIVASFSRFPRTPKNHMSKILFFCYVRWRSLLRITIWFWVWFENHQMLKIAQLTLKICFWKFISSFETWWYFLGFCLAYLNKEKRRAKKPQKFSKNELELIFVTLNQEQMNKIRSQINIRAFTK